MSENKEEVKLIVRNITENRFGEYVQVILERNVFLAVTGYTPKLPFTTISIKQPDGTQRGGRVFTIDGLQLLTVRDKETRNTMFLMAEADAKKVLHGDGKPRATIELPVLSFA